MQALQPALLRHSKTVGYVYLQSSGIDDQQALLLADTLYKLTQLRRVVLGGNPVTEEGRKALEEWKRTTKKYLDLFL